MSREQSRSVRMTAGRRHALISALFGLVLALVCAEILYTHDRTEPYPGLFQPSFGSVPLNATAEMELEPAVVVVERDGSRRTVAYQALLPSATGVIESAVFRSAFYDPARAEAPQTRAWLRERLRALQGNDDAVTVIIQWQQVEYSLATRRRTVRSDDRRIVVPLRSAA